VSRKRVGLGYACERAREWKYRLKEAGGGSGGTETGVARGISTSFHHQKGRREKWSGSHTRKSIEPARKKLV